MIILNFFLDDMGGESKSYQVPGILELYFDLWWHPNEHQMSLGKTIDEKVCICPLKQFNNDV